jgi:hypothetical protein
MKNYNSRKAENNEKNHLRMGAEITKSASDTSTAQKISDLPLVFWLAVGGLCGFVVGLALRQ